MVMKRILLIATLVVFACSSIFLLSSCAKKQVVAEEKEITAPPEEVAKVEEEKPPAVEVAREVKEEEEFKKAEEARIERLKELEMARKKEAEERALKERIAIKFEAESIYFDFDKSFIRQEYRPVLEKKAEFLVDNPNISIRIEGNCDERGTNEYNLALGERRTNSAKNFFVSIGISPDRIEMISYGEERPLALGHNENSWVQNRRDDFVVIKK
jgi:peptidoglycan-associated lipoprotein